MNYKNYNDYELIYMVRENDDNSKDILYDKYQPVICNIALDYYHRYSEYGSDYDDFYQEAMYAFDRAIVNYNEDKNTLLYTFIVVCVKRHLLSYVRSITNTKKNISNSQFVEIDNDITKDSKSDISSILNEKEIENICKELIYNDSLNIDETSMLELKMNGFSFKEISILLGISASNVEFKFREIRKLLKKELSKTNCK